MGLQLEDFRAVGEARNREEAIQRVTDLKAKFKLGFKKMVTLLHPDRNGGDLEKTAQFHLLMAVAKEFDSLKFKAPPPTTVRYHTTFGGPIPPQPPKRQGVPQYYPTGYPGTATQNRYSTKAAKIVEMRPTGVTSPRGR
jgi:hypothetical protein